MPQFAELKFNTLLQVWFLSLMRLWVILAAPPATWHLSALLPVSIISILCLLPLLVLHAEYQRRHFRQLNKLKAMEKRCVNMNLGRTAAPEICSHHMVLASCVCLPWWNYLGAREAAAWTGWSKPPVGCMRNNASHDMIVLWNTSAVVECLALVGECCNLISNQIGLFVYNQFSCYRYVFRSTLHVWISNLHVEWLHEKIISCFLLLFILPSYMIRPPTEHSFVLGSGFGAKRAKNCWHF